MNFESRITKLEDAVFNKIVTSTQIMRVLEDITDRACQKKQIPSNMGLSNFIDWLRSLYPELYQSKTHQPNSKITDRL